MDDITYHVIRMRKEAMDIDDPIRIRLTSNLDYAFQEDHFSSVFVGPRNACFQANCIPDLYNIPDLYKRMITAWSFMRPPRKYELKNRA